MQKSQVASIAVRIQGWEFGQGRLFLVSDLSHSLTSLIFGERPERFAHIAHQK